MVLLYQLWLALSERRNMNKNRVNGSIVEKNGTWYARLYVTDEKGKRKQIWRTTKLPVKNNKRKAEAFLQDLIEKYSKECRGFYSEFTVADYFEMWLKDIKSEVRPNTYRSYKGNMEKHIIPYFREKGIRLQELKPCDLTDYYKFKNNTDSKLEKAEPLSPRTIQHHHQNISKALNDAVEKGYINYNPDANSKRPKLKTFNAKFLNQKQINNMLTAIKDNIIYLPVLLCSIYGLRRSEVLGIKWEYIDFENNTIHICETLQQCTKELTGESNYTDDTKNASSNRTMPLIPLIKEKLLVQKQWQIENKKDFEELYLDSDFVFTHENGKVITPNYLTKNFRKIADSLGYYGLRLHDLRHSVASNLLNKGFSYVQTAEWLGHSNPSTTFRFYAHVDKTSKMAIASDYEKIFGEEIQEEKSPKVVEKSSKIVEIDFTQNYISTKRKPQKRHI